MKYCNDRRSTIFCGELLGGTSRINGMVYSRGSPGDYNAWAEMGHPQWSYEKVLPYFVTGETTLSQPKSNYRGSSGTIPGFIFLIF
jgi:choline dehydrogenase-like flavoprotein